MVDFQEILSWGNMDTNGLLIFMEKDVGHRVFFKIIMLQ